MENTDDLIGIIGLELLSGYFLGANQYIDRANYHAMTHLGVEFCRLWNVADHLRVGELFLRLAILRDLEDANLACASWGHSHKLREVVGEIVHHARFRQEERLGALFFVVDARPDHLEAALRLQLPRC